MTRDIIKTIAGLIIIVGIVVATFLYGSSQRKAQLTHDQQVKAQQQTKAQQQAKAVSPSTAPTTNAKPSTGSSAGTAPVKSPAKNTVQGGSVPSPTTGVVAGATAPVTPTAGGSGAPLPQTGPETLGAIGLSSIGVMVLAVRRSRFAMLKAARTRR